MDPRVEIEWPLALWAVASALAMVFLALIMAAYWFGSRIYLAITVSLFGILLFAFGNFWTQVKDSERAICEGSAAYYAQTHNLSQPQLEQNQVDCAENGQNAAGPLLEGFGISIGAAGAFDALQSLALRRERLRNA